MCSNGHDPLALRPGTLWGLQSIAARSAWMSYGSSLPDLSEVDRTAWHAFIDALDPQDSFHPVFGRTDFQDWIDEASLSNSTRRIALISGDKGVGKSFLAEILKARVAVIRAPVIVVSPELVRTKSLIGVLNAVSREAGAKQANLDLLPTRPKDGVLKNDVLPDAFNLLNKLIQAKNAGSFWLFVDVGEDGIESDGGSISPGVWGCPGFDDLDGVAVGIFVGAVADGLTDDMEPFCFSRWCGDIDLG